MVSELRSEPSVAFCAGPIMSSPPKSSSSTVETGTTINSSIEGTNHLHLPISVAIN
ncbi:hypothetical protein A2U01_0036072 [Trifolium medium]|uniref:Uncharacterized protein n=1 Tax=Trifolium medium TaxID=97028 RepID=A0A392PTF7_9FABA|nr:hypothetical protein [Trifolium medium]